MPVFAYHSIFTKKSIGRQARRWTQRRGPQHSGQPAEKLVAFCSDASGKSKPARSPSPPCLTKRTEVCRRRALQALKRNHHVVSIRSRAHTKSREAAGDREESWERLGSQETGAGGSQPSSPAIARRKRAQRGQRGQADKEKPAECQAGSADKTEEPRRCWKDQSAVWWRAEGGTRLGTAPGGEGGRGRVCTALTCARARPSHGACCSTALRTHSYKINFILLCSGPLGFPIWGARSYSAHKCLFIEAENSSVFSNLGGGGNIF